MRRTVILLALALSLTASCSGRERTNILQELAGSQSVRVKVAKGETRRDLTVRVQPLSLPTDRAFAVASYVVTEHCIRWTGRSSADWVTDADGRPRSGVDGDARVFSVRCSG